MERQLAKKSEGLKSPRPSRENTTRPGDAFELDANRRAEAALATPTCAACGNSCGKSCSQEPPVDQRGVSKLPAQLRMQLEIGFGQPLDHVRLHRGAEAERRADANAARAYSEGSDIVLGRAVPPLGSLDGQKLLAHEVAHVTQGSSGPRVRRLATEASECVLVDDDVTPNVAQMRIADFFAIVRQEVTAAANAELACIGRSASDCPYIEKWISHYQSMPAAHVERAATLYTGSAASDARDLVALIVARATEAVRRWISTGEVDDLPMTETDQPDTPDTELTVQRKATSTGRRSEGDVEHSVSRLGPGVSLEPSSRAPMEKALGRSFADVRVHHDARGDAAARNLDSLAFTAGRQIAFASGRFRPGTLEGDLLLAHELAHVAQQQGGARGAMTTTKDPSLEQEADFAALAAIQGDQTEVHSGAGLRLQRCSKSEERTPAPSPTPKPVPTCVKPSVTVTMTGKMKFKGLVVNAVQPTDVSGELACEPFELRSSRKPAAVTYPAGTRVLPTAWVNTARTVNVMVDDGTGTTFDTEKSNLRPASPATAGITQYSAHVDDEASKLEKQQSKLDDWDKTKDAYKKNPAAWQEGHDSLTKLRDDYAKVLNELEIQQFMFNRFDKTVVDLVNKANKDNGYDKTDPLDPDVVKSILYHETELGTAGPFLDDVSAGKNHDIVNHYNVGQAVDSSAEMYARYFLKKDPGRVAKFSLANILTDMYKAKEAAEKANTKFDGESYLRSYPNFQDACEDLWKSGGVTPLNKTYGHWIEMLIFELFVKRKLSSNWGEAVRRYNGSGSDAIAYGKEVMARAKNAAASRKKGEPFVPTREL